VSWREFGEECVDAAGEIHDRDPSAVAEELLKNCLLITGAQPIAPAGDCAVEQFLGKKFW
jgi:hypothetical protein